MAIAINDSGEPRVKRNLLITAVNVGDGTADWEKIGVDIEDSSIEFNADIQTITDILGNTSTRVNKIEPKQSFEPYTLRKKSKLAAKLLDIISRNALAELSGFEVLVIQAYVDATGGGYYAEKHVNCTIVPTRLGGSNDVEMPIEVYFSNDKTIGKVNDYKSAITFTASAN
jgi:hypothetical protein